MLRRSSQESSSSLPASRQPGNEGPRAARLNASQQQDAGATAHVVTGSDDGVARLWAFDRRSCRHAAVLKSQPEAGHQGHTGGLTSVSFRGSAKTVADDVILTSSRDRTVKVWSCLGALRGTMPAAGGAPSRGHTDCVNMASWGDDAARVLSCSDDGSAIVWDAESGLPRSLLRRTADGRQQHGHTLPVSMATWSRDRRNHDTHMVTCSHDRTCILWKYREPDADILSPYPSSRTDADAHKKAVWSAYTSLDDRKIVSASMDKTVKVWDTEKGVCQRTFVGHTDMVFGATWSQDDSEVLSHSLDSTAMLWDLRTEGPIMKLKQHSACVWSAKWGRKLNSQSIVTASHDMTAMVFDRRLGMPKMVLKGHLGILWGASLSADEKWAVTWSEDCTARVWDITSGTAREPHVLGGAGPHRHTQPVTCAAFHEPRPQ